MNQSLDNIKIQVGEPMNLIGVTLRNVSAKLFTGAEMTQMYHRMLTWATSSQRLEIWSALHSLPAAQPVKEWLFQATSSVDLSLFQEARLVSVSPR